MNLVVLTIVIIAAIGGIVFLIGYTVGEKFRGG